MVALQSSSVRMTAALKMTFLQWVFISCLTLWTLEDHMVNPRLATTTTEWLAPVSSLSTTSSSGWYLVWWLVVGIGIWLLSGWSFCKERILVTMLCFSGPRRSSKAAWSGERWWSLLLKLEKVATMTRRLKISQTRKTPRVRVTWTRRKARKMKLRNQGYWGEWGRAAKELWVGWWEPGWPIQRWPTAFFTQTRFIFPTNPGLGKSWGGFVRFASKPPSSSRPHSGQAASHEEEWEGRGGGEDQSKPRSSFKIS